jgi:hypothetical protein
MIAHTRAALLPANLSCPATVMQFTLVFNGRLPGAGNNPKPDYVRDIRDALHPQLEYLWQVSGALKRLRRTARVPDGRTGFMSVEESPLDVEFDPKTPLPPGMVDLCKPIIRGAKEYIPLVRKSLDLACALEVLFLRQEDPGALVLQGGDLDNRIKTLCDALRIPDEDVEARYPQKQSPTYCLLESDSLVSALDVSTERLLFPQTKYPNEVHLVISATVRVLRVGVWNVCLL